VAKQEMVGGREGGGAVFASRRVDAQSVAIQEATQGSFKVIQNPTSLDNAS